MGTGRHMICQTGLRRPGKLVLPSDQGDADQDKGCGGGHSTKLQKCHLLAPPHMGETIGEERQLECVRVWGVVFTVYL